MAPRYFDLSEDIQSGNWDLGDPRDAQGNEVEDPWMFRAGQPVQVQGRLTIPVDATGRRLDFSTAGIGVTPVVHVSVASLFAQLAPDDVQLIPVDVPGQPDSYLILVATKLIRCIDDEASQVQFWKPEDDLPEKVGQYSAVDSMHIDPSKVGDAKVFRTWGWDIALIVSEDLKSALEQSGATGMKFTPV
ncbi:hypothetical protein MXAN_7452 [Myxococcus xanthus DK 1622]|uniref:Immunity MXAN-0049 protein domain-containing protein n=1 Tax=Myxococcus xanthus (strain DK1622) TaxID=246197 RepID=Q1CVL6_MYXXD|nr:MULTISPECIES: DUF1629 domain-containing protein [Myxococcus]ABF87170.1 hypothetical protein MXAN_7452 [Myxococcus xanthus DK 1622]NOJ56960.1 hypothetical protein [Myxococcus xanthus]QPM79678.1 hypothetical protein I5Q59_36625 [Myxococcus xanthus]QVW68758.1 hypothetical protein JTM82_04155 [Myxococcus xanthus DZ2]QZZ55040.1 hypothetical protein MyxoNM_38390 [Myxococcus xanthus]